MSLEYSKGIFRTASPFKMTDKTKREKILNIALCALVNDGKILLLKRNKEPYKDHWGLVGGKMEFGEHIEETAVREFFEETGIKTNFDSLAGIASEVLHSEGEKTAHFLIYVAKLKSETTEIKESDEGELKWFELNNLDKSIMIPSDYVMITEYIMKNNPLKVHKVKMVQNGEKYDVEEFL
jgi:ADP-ribose pyrophosphatase YjhB (NUDIX family)